MGRSPGSITTTGSWPHVSWAWIPALASRGRNDSVLLRRFASVFLRATLGGGELAAYLRQLGPVGRIAHERSAGRGFRLCGELGELLHAAGETLALIVDLEARHGVVFVVHHGSESPRIGHGAAGGAQRREHDREDDTAS